MLASIPTFNDMPTNVSSDHMSSMVSMQLSARVSGAGAPPTFTRLYDDMLHKFANHRLEELTRAGATYTFNGPIANNNPENRDFDNPAAYNPPKYPATILDAKKMLIKQGLPLSVWNFVERTCEQYDIDPSHGLEHAVRVATWCMMLNSKIDKEINYNELGIGVIDLRDVSISGGFIHDALDDKYIPAEDMISLQEELRGILLDAYHDKHIMQSIIGAINCISFSARYDLMNSGKHPLPTVMQVADELLPMTNLCRVGAHIIADADMIDAYNPIRCRDFRVHKNPAVYADWETNPAIRRKLHAGVGGIIRNRVLYYRDIYMFTEAAKKYAEPLHALAYMWAVAETADIPDGDLTYHPAGNSAHAMRIASTPLSLL